MGISLICCETALFRCVDKKKQGVIDECIGHTLSYITFLKKKAYLADSNIRSMRSRASCKW